MEKLKKKEVPRKKSSLKTWAGRGALIGGGTGGALGAAGGLAFARDYGGAHIYAPSLGLALGTAGAAVGGLTGGIMGGTKDLIRRPKDEKGIAKEALSHQESLDYAKRQALAGGLAGGAVGGALTGLAGEYGARKLEKKAFIIGGALGHLRGEELAKDPLYRHKMGDSYKSDKSDLAGGLLYSLSTFGLGAPDAASYHLMKKRSYNKRVKDEKEMKLKKKG